MELVKAAAKVFLYKNHPSTTAHDIDNAIAEQQQIRFSPEHLDY